MSLLDDMPDGGEPFDPYFVPDDWARLQYGRMLWKYPASRARLLHHWCDPRHPWHERFGERYRPWVERLLTADPEQDDALDRSFQEEGHSLRTLIREIPPVFGAFY